MPLNTIVPSGAGNRSIRILDDIPGIGDTRRKALLRKFKSVEDIRDAIGGRTGTDREHECQKRPSGL